MKIAEIKHLLSKFQQECPFNKYGLPFESMLAIEQELVIGLSEVVKSSPEDVQQIREFIDFHLVVTLNEFAMRMANAAIVLNDDKLVQIAIIAISLDNDEDLDDRDVIRTGALLNDCCERRKLDSIKVFQEGLKLATNGRRNLLIDQIKSAPTYMRSLRAMGFGVVDDDSGFKYVDFFSDGLKDIDFTKIL